MPAAGGIVQAVVSAINRKQQGIAEAQNNISESMQSFTSGIQGGPGVGVSSNTMPSGSRANYETASYSIPQGKNSISYKLADSNGTLPQIASQYGNKNWLSQHAFNDGSAFDIKSLLGSFINSQDMQ